MADAAKPEPGWYILLNLNPNPDPIQDTVFCARLPNETYLLRCGWTLGPRVEDLLRDAERIEWLGRVDLTEYWDTVFNTSGPMAFRTAIDAEIAREKAGQDE